MRSLSGREARLRLVRSWFTVTVLAVLLAADVEAQQPPVFRAGVELLEVDVSVVDDEGEPIKDLSSAEFAVSIDGEPRRVVSAQFVDLRPMAATSGAAAGPAPPVSYSANTTGGRGRVIVLAIDRESIDFSEGRETLAAATAFLDTLGPNDQVAFLTVPPPGPAAIFTTDHELLKDELELAVGIGSGRIRTRADTLTVAEAIAISSDLGLRAGGSQAKIQACGTREDSDPCVMALIEQAQHIATESRRQTMESVWTLERLLEGFREIDGRKSVVWISHGMITNNGDELFGVRSLAAAARATVHVILLDEPYLSAESLDNRFTEELGLQLLAGFTGGTVQRALRHADHAFARIERETSGYYLLGVEPLEDDLDGKGHEIDVSVLRPDTNLRARREFIHRSADRESTEASDERLRRLLGSPVAVSDLPLRVATYAYQEADSSEVRVLIASDFERALADPVVTFGYLLFGEDGEIAASGGGPATVGPADQARGPLIEQLDVVIVEPGRYTLKLAAVEDGGRHGSVVHSFDACRMSDVPFAVSDLMLAAAPAGEDAAVRPLVEPWLRDGRLMTYLELYADDPAGIEGLQVRIDVAEDPAAPALVSQAGDFLASDTPAVQAVSTMLRVDLLPSGPYIVRAAVTRDGEELERLSRPFQIVRSPAELVGFGWRGPGRDAGGESRGSGHGDGGGGEAVRAGTVTRCEPGR